jgi:hypothetical protein
VFALVLHEETGLPIVDFYFHRFSRKNFCHSAVRLKRGVFIDVRGRQTMAQMNKYYGNGIIPALRLKCRMIGNATAKRRLANFARHNGFIADLTLAHRVIRRFKSRYAA